MLCLAMGVGVIHKCRQHLAFVRMISNRLPIGSRKTTDRVGRGGGEGEGERGEGKGERGGGDEKLKLAG